MTMDQLQHSKYVGIEHRNMAITAKSLFMSQSPNYVFNEVQFDQTWETLQCAQTSQPTSNPTQTPNTEYPTDIPSKTPTFNPSITPTFNPSVTPTEHPSGNPTIDPTHLPTDREG